MNLSIIMNYIYNMLSNTEWRIQTKHRVTLNILEFHRLWSSGFGTNATRR